MWKKVEFEVKRGKKSGWWLVKWVKEEDGKVMVKKFVMRKVDEFWGEEEEVDEFE